VQANAAQATLFCRGPLTPRFKSTKYFLENVPFKQNSDDQTRVDNKDRCNEFYTAAIMVSNLWVTPSSTFSTQFLCHGTARILAH
jgi:hypothetical protein